MLACCIFYLLAHLSTYLLPCLIAHLLIILLLVYIFACLHASLLTFYLLTFLINCKHAYIVACLFATFFLACLLNILVSHLLTLLLAYLLYQNPMIFKRFVFPKVFVQLGVLTTISFYYQLSGGGFILL